MNSRGTRSTIHLDEHTKTYRKGKKSTVELEKTSPDREDICREKGPDSKKKTWTHGHSSARKKMNRNTKHKVLYHKTVQKMAVAQLV